MNVDYVNPFIEATKNVFDKMLSCSIERTGLGISENYSPEYEITGIIGLSGRVSGDVVISFEKQLAFAATEALLNEPVQSICDEVIDTVGEMTNMIAGNAKSNLEKYKLSLALPTVIVGKNHSIRFPSTVKPIAISFRSPPGDCCIKVGLIETDALKDQEKLMVASV